VAEVAWLAKASHQRVSYWAKRSGIDARECRELHLTEEWGRLHKSRRRR
jgi:hypothetical protein